jgi:hypothetical protein
MRLSLLLGLVALAALSFVSPRASEESDEMVLVIKQDYSIAELGKGGMDAKDVRQIVYIRRDWVCIDEVGKGANPVIVESIVLDLKNRQIINLDHENKKKFVESFDVRRKRLDDKKKEARENIDDLTPGPQRDKTAKLWHAMLDDSRNFVLVADVAPPKVIAGVKCKEAQIAVEKEKGYIPMEAYLHPDLELPYDNTEVLYLLRLIGKHLSDFLRENKDTFKKVPMELHIDLAAGGKLDTVVVSVDKTTASKLDFTSRGPLGSPFEIPGNYTDKDKTQTPTSTKPPPKEKP